MSERPQIVIVSGLSGSGKTAAIKALEDAGFFCIDNLPLTLAPRLVELAEDARTGLNRLGLVIDARERTFLPAFTKIIDELREAGTDLRIWYLTADDETLIRRYTESRRRHPLSTHDVRAGILAEQQLLAPVARAADTVIDTTHYNVHELHNEVLRLLGVTTAGRGLSVSILSFGYKHGLPAEADLLFDARFLPNPHYEMGLRALTGLDPAVIKFVFETGEAEAFLKYADDFLKFALPLYEREGKSYLTIAIGCTGGQHRSVALAQALAERLSARGVAATVRHRDARFNRPITKETAET